MRTHAERLGLPHVTRRSHVAERRIHRLPQRARGDPGRRAAGGRRHRGGAGRPARVPQAHRERELRLSGHPAGHGQLVQRQVRRGHHRPALLRRLPERRHRRGARRRTREGAVRRRPRVRAAALRHRRQPGRVLGDPGRPGRVPRAEEGPGTPGQRPHRGGLVRAAPRAGQPADARHVAGRRRSPHPRLPAEHLRQDVRPAQLRHRPGHRPDRLRQRRRGGPRVQAADPGGRLLCVPAEGQLPDHAGDRRLGGRHLHGRHGALRRPGRRQGLHRRLRPGAARAHRHHHHPQVAARPARRHGALRARASPTRSTGAARWCSAARCRT